MEGKADGKGGYKEDPIQLWSQWQLIDSILPTGGFAHSLGLEAAIQARVVNNLETLESFVIQVLENTGSLILPFVNAATVSPDIETWHALDSHLDAMLTNQVARKASVTQGSALARVASAVFKEELPNLKQSLLSSSSSGSSGRTCCLHHAPIYGLVWGLLGMDPRTSQRAYMYITLRDVVSAATRLNVIGPQGAAVLQHRLTFAAERILAKWIDRHINDACQTVPLLDTLQGCHPYLFSKMFCS